VIIDPIDIKLIRQLELQGSISIPDIIAKFHIPKDEILLRIKNFEEAGFISGYGLKVSVPNLLGGKWYLCCAFTEARVQAKPETLVPLLEEKIENMTFPAGISPNLSFLFYTQDLKDSYKIINKMPGLDYAEIYKVNEYSVTIPVLLSSEDQELMLKLCDMKLDYQRINTIIFEPQTDTEVKYSRLIWHKRNRHGVITIFPQLNWNVVNNYAHLHVAVSTAIRSRELRKMIGSLGFSANLTAKFKKRFLQVEFDIWGFSDMQQIIAALDTIKRLEIVGCSFAHRNIICDGWLKGFIEHRI